MSMVTENSSVKVVLAPQQKTVEATPTLDVDQVLTLYIPVLPIDEHWSYLACKRIVDIGVATFALIFLSVPMLILALLIKLQDGGPVIYRQARTGRYGVPFSFLKFRSMRVDSDQFRQQLLEQSDAAGVAFKMKNDPRVTPLGRFIRKYSLDELPQLFSVLTGQMTVVGPRPHLPEEVKEYTFEQRARLLVKPGLICLREVNGRSHLSFDEWIRLDLEYVQHRSLAYDAKIILKAVPAVLRGDGAY